MSRPRDDSELAKELDELRARLAAAHQEEQQRRVDLEQLRKDFAKISDQLRRLRETRGEPPKRKA
jgi:septal ring factor EnvC (AmiA/AmiB activator)